MHPYLLQELAAGRAADARRNAEHYRLVRQAAGARPAGRPLRRLLAPAWTRLGPAKAQAEARSAGARC